MKRSKKWWQNHRINESGIVERLCSICKEWKEENEFNFSLHNKSKPEKGFCAECKICGRKRSLQYVYTHKEEHDKSRTQWYWDNREDMLQKFRDWREENKDWKQQYQLEYQRKNPDKMKIYSEKRRHKNHKITKNEWNECLKYFNHRCAYCGLPIEDHYNMYMGKLRWENLNKEHVDHNGGNDLTNCIPSCKSCNDTKNEKDFDDFYNVSNSNYTQERYDRIVQWLMEDCFKYIEEKKPRAPYGSKKKAS